MENQNGKKPGADWFSKLFAGTLDINEYEIDALVKTDLAGKILDANIVYKEMLGYSIEELREMTIHDITPVKWKYITAETPMNFLLETGYSPPIEKEYRRKDGKTIPVEVQVIVRHNEDNDPIGFWSIIRDITERKQKEKRLERYKNLLEESQQIANIGSWEYDLITKALIWTDQMFILFGYQPKEFTPTWDYVTERIHPADSKTVLDHWKKILEEKDFPAFEFRIITHAGQVRWMRAMGRVFFDIVGNVECIIGTLQDFTSIRTS